VRYSTSTYFNLFLVLITLICSSAQASEKAKKSDTTTLESIGRLLFFDTQLSEPAGQSCASCHNPQTAYADENKITSLGARNELTGTRNAPSLSYSAFTPKWHFNQQDETWIGGFFHDGRATTMQQQALMPMFDPLEMAIPTKLALVDRVRNRPYAQLIESVFGTAIWQNTPATLDAIALALSSFEASDSFAQRFSSKYDAYLRKQTELSDAEARGLALFEDEKKGNCAACHQSKVSEQGDWPLFTDFSYDNLGVPKNPRLAFYQLPPKYNPLGAAHIDEGLANNPNIADPNAQRGKYKVPTLRNIALTPPYMHNGFFEDLTLATEFYNTRDSNPEWSTPEVAENVNKDELGDLKLSKQDVQDIVAFLHTLTDGWQQKSSKLAKQ
jgi:cytochrome c peroxidase